MPKKAEERAQGLGTDGLPDASLPVVWLLGKTGAGKSSLVRALTGQTEAEIGNGFAPCTRSARSYDFPAHEPLVRFLRHTGSWRGAVRSSGGSRPMPRAEPRRARGLPSG